MALGTARYYSEHIIQRHLPPQSRPTASPSAREASLRAHITWYDRRRADLVASWHMPRGCSGSTQNGGFATIISTCFTSRCAFSLASTAHWLTCASPDRSSRGPARTPHGAHDSPRAPKPPLVRPSRVPRRSAHENAGASPLQAAICARIRSLSALCSGCSRHRHLYTPLLAPRNAYTSSPDQVSNRRVPCSRR